MGRKGMPDGSRSQSGGPWKVLQLEYKIPVLRSYMSRLFPPTAAAITYHAMLSASQVAGMALGVSCATPILAPVLGTLSVASASVAAAQVSFALRKVCGQPPPSQKQAHVLPKEHVLFYAVFGVLAFKALGGSCRNLMPSDVAHPGALARASVPAKGARYAGSGFEAQVVKDFYKRNGCHHCGKRGGDGIADHMPPNVLIHGKGWAKGVENTEVITGNHKSSLISEKMMSWLLHGAQDAKQRYFPQCVDCMKLQGVSLRHGKRSLVFHFRRAFPEPPFLAGFCVGAFQLDDLDPKEHSRHKKGK